MYPKLTLEATAEVLPARNFAGALLTNRGLSDLMTRLADEIDRPFDISTPEFPAERVGVHERGVLDHGSTTRDLAVEAARRAFGRSAAALDEIRCVIVSSVTPDRTFPALATTVHASLECAPGTVAFDVSIGCNGFLVALDLAARQLVDAPEGAAAIVVAAETMVRVADATDRTTCPIFGDGAGAVVLRRSATNRLRPVRVWTLGDRGPRIELRPTPEEVGPVHRIVARDGELDVAPDPHARHSIVLEGKRVFRDMVRTLPEFVNAYLDDQRVRLEEVDRFLFHQANARMTEAVAGSSGLALPAERVLSNIAQVGNTASASLPILLAQAADAGDLRSGDLALLLGFGSGYSIGATLLEWK